jgi:hypothetical protein
LLQISLMHQFVIHLLFSCLVSLLAFQVNKV